MTFQRGGWLVWFTILMAMMLSIFILPSWANWLRPDFLLLVLMYWALALDNRAGIGLAFCMGILLDVLTDTLLGQHALALVVVIYIVLKLQRRMRVFPMLQKMAIVALLSFIYLLILYWTQSFIRAAPHSAFFWLPVFINSLLWPWIFSLLRAARRLYNVEASST